MVNELFNSNAEWQKANKYYLITALRKIRTALGETEGSREDYLTELSSHNALKMLSHIFDLSDFECNILLLCVGMEIYADWGFLCANAGGNHPKQPYPTFSLAMAVLPNPDWEALIPTSPLRKWQLICLGDSSVLNLTPLGIDERILHYLMGFPHLDERLQGVVELISGESCNHVASHWQLAKQLATTWQQTAGEIRLPILQLCGDEVASKRAIAWTACQLLNLNLHLMSAAVIISLNSNEVKDLLHLWFRESRLTNSALLLDCDEIDTSDPAKEGAIARLIEHIYTPLIITSRERRRSLQRSLITIEVHKPSASEQRTIWQNLLGETATNFNGHIETLVSHFSLNASAIATVCTETIGKLKGEETLSELLWDTCRSQARPRLDELAQAIEVGATWDDLVLPELQRQVLHDVAAHVRQRAKVYEQWGFGNKGGRGLGISALFAGASGTGKTMAAEVIAAELRLDLYRIDLSSVVSKYIGETEKNLRRVFDAAEAGGAILLFDEADALFGKRSEVKDSHDRHANIEVSYLLQRMEAYRGLAILTTNLKGSLDQAFLRRIRFIVQFPFPDFNQRMEIWQRVFPSLTPTQGLDPSLLARLNVSGGNIRNIALNAAFLAADAGEIVEMKHILQAAKSEYAKLERPLTDVEVKGWL